MRQRSGELRVKASCGETVVQKGVFGGSVSSLPPSGLLSKHLQRPENLKGAKKKRTLQKHPFWTTVSPRDAFAASLARPHQGKRGKFLSQDAVCLQKFHDNQTLESLEVFGLKFVFVSRDPLLGGAKILDSLFPGTTLNDNLRSVIIRSHAVVGTALAVTAAKL